jgi:hypothetical protein
MRITRAGTQPSQKGSPIQEALDGNTVEWMEKVTDEPDGK